MASSGRTMLTKIWDQHVIARLSDDTDLLHVDRHLLHDLGGSRGLLDLKSRGLPVHNPELTFATPDHAISTAHGRAGTIKIGQELLAALRVETSASGIRMFDVDEPGQGIVHVIGPELGLSLPGCLIVCGDIHTCTLLSFQRAQQQITIAAWCLQGVLTTRCITTPAFPR